MTPIEIVPLTVAIGADVRGVDLGQRLSADAVAAIERALLEHLVLRFREQDITPAQQVAFARQFGAVGEQVRIAPTPEDEPEYLVLDESSPRGKGADAWHSDNTFMAEPPLGTILRAVELPPLGGDTCFASMYAALEALSPALRDMLEGLSAVHDITPSLKRSVRAGHPRAIVAAGQSQWPPVLHPVLRTHPRTGRKALFVNSNSTTRIVELSEAESARVLAFLLEHAGSPEFQCRFRWEPNTLIFWDNRAAQHYAVADYGVRRVMNRVTIAGDRPF